MMISSLFIASDHAGFNLKAAIIEYLENEFPNIQIADLGCNSEASCDYSDYAVLLAQAIKDNLHAFGILICGSGVGISIAANRFSWVRAALCNTPEIAFLARNHNNANVLVLGARNVTEEQNLAIIHKFLNSEFSMDLKHSLRVEKLNNLNNREDE